MLIASIFPALLACVLGADVSVLLLSPKLNITLPFIGIRKWQSVLHGNVIIKEGSASTSPEPGPDDLVVHVPPNTAFTLPLLGLPTPKSVMHGNAPLRQGSYSKPCEIGEPCYQSITAREYGLVNGYPNGGKGIIVAYPVDKTKSPSAIIFQKKGDTSADPSIPVGVGVTKRIEVDPKAYTDAFIWYADGVQDTRLSGNIEFPHRFNPSTNSYVYIAPYLYEETKKAPFLVLTGRLENKPMEYKVIFSDSFSPIIRLVPKDVPDPIPTTIRVAFSGVHYLKPWKILICLLPAIITTAMH